MKPKTIRGIVIGKFYPVHLGHCFLIETALANVEHLTVIVCDDPKQAIPAKTRAGWLQELFPAAAVVVTPDDLPDEPVPWAKRTLEIMPEPPDVVFTSESYGDGFARALSCRHQLVDIDRTRYPISGSLVRDNPYAHWNMLPEPVRAFFALRVVVIGVESTGKSTLAEQLSQELKTIWVPEVGREWTLRKYSSGDMEWSESDFIEIAQEQLRNELAACRTAHRVVVADTDAYATCVWATRYLGRRVPEVEAVGTRTIPDLYLLTHADFPFVQDGIRDGEAIRGWMHEEFVNRLAERDIPVVHISGTREERLGMALEAIESLVARNPRVRILSGS